MAGVQDFRGANPFTEGPAGAYFVGREPELQMFQGNLQGLKQRYPVHVFVAGLHGTGKSSYLNKLAQIAEENQFAGVYLKLDDNVTAYKQLYTIVEAVIRYIGKSSSLAGSPRRIDLMRDYKAGVQSKLFELPRDAEFSTEGLRQDFETLEGYIQAIGRDGAVICIDEGQRITPFALSAIKNALETIGFYQVVLSIRLVSDVRGAIADGQAFLEERATRAEGDIGAARFFVAGTAMGPFVTDEEVRNFFRARLSKSSIQFATDVLTRLGEITDRLPRDMVKFANRLYTKALRDQVSLVDRALFDDCFREEHKEQLKHVFEMYSDASEALKSTLIAMVDLVEPITARELVDYAFPSMVDDARALIAQGTERQLEKLAAASIFIKKVDDKYRLSNNVYRYALKIAFKRT